MNGLSPGLRARVLLQKHGFQAAHALGQNFLMDESLLSHLIDLSGVTMEDDVLEIRHTIKNRRTLALGAVIAAEFLNGKRGVYTMDDLLK